MRWGRLKGITRSPRFIYVADSLIWVWLGAACLLAAITFLLAPNDLTNSPVEALLRPYDYLWNICFGLGGLMLLIGIFSDKPQIEAFGLCAFTGGLLTLALSTALLAGLTPGVFTYPALAAAAVWRVVKLMRTTHDYREEVIT